MISKSPADTSAIAREYASRLEPQAAGATVIALSGDLGAGKTTFAKAFASAFGIPESEVTSPTFVIEKKFPISGRPFFKALIHIDAYRLERPEEIERLGWKEIISDRTHVVLIEWPEHIGTALPSNAARISFVHKDGDEREILFT